MVHPFDDDTAITALDNGAHAATLTDRWGRLGGGPLGGYTLCVALAAMHHVVPQPDPLVVTAHFLRPGRLGAAEIAVDVVRIGRRTATASAVLSQTHEPIIAALATFGELSAFTGGHALFNAPPQLPSPDDCLDWRTTDERSDGVTIRDRVECRIPPAAEPSATATQPRQEFWIRLREPRTLDLRPLPLLVDAAPPAVMLLGYSGDLTLELTVHLRAHPSSQWLAARATVRHLANGLHEEDFELWDIAGTLVAQSRQLALVPAA
jgi:acyl-CoA thioesterase